MKLKRENDYAKYFLTVQHANSAIRNATHRGKQQQKNRNGREEWNIWKYECDDVRLPLSPFLSIPYHDVIFDAASPAHIAHASRTRDE